MERRAAKLLQDALDCCIAIERAVESVDLATFQTDRVVRSAVMWEFTVIGEALNRLRQEFPSVAEKLTDVRRIVAFRNVIVHGYHAVVDEEVWRIVRQQLPALRGELEHLLGPGAS